MDRDLLSLIESRLHTQADHPLYSFLDRSGAVTQSLTAASLFAAADKLAEVLLARSLQRQPVVLLYPHGSQFIVAFFAAILAGAWPVPVARPHGRDWRTFSGIVRASGARTLLSVSTTSRHLPSEIVDQHSLQIINTDSSEDCDLNRPVLRRRFDYNSHPTPEDTAFIQYTSGSTSAPKGVVISHANILHNCEQIRQAFRCSTADTGVSWLPFHHDMGLIGHVLTPLYCGIHNYFLAPADFSAQPVRWLEAISRYRGTISGAPDFAYELCHARLLHKEQEQMLDTLDLSSWRLAYCGAQRVAADTLRKFATRFARAGFDARAVHPCYGMAEATLFVCSRNGLRTHRHPLTGQENVSIGQLQESVDVRIVAPASNREVEEGTEGEILVSSASVARGYHEDDARIAEVFGATVLSGEEEKSGEQNSCRYLRTGDLGYIWQGELYFTGRCKNLIKRRGRSFHAEDIESEVETLLRHKGVLRSAAFELEPDAEDSLVILLELDSVADPQLIEREIPLLQSRLCESPGILATHIRLTPRRSLPLTSSGKLQRLQCRERFLAGEYENNMDGEPNKEHEHARECQKVSHGAGAADFA
ncbi:MAG: fatty acyl-AMP ligase [Pseudomonadota bacterium]